MPEYLQKRVQEMLKLLTPLSSGEKWIQAVYDLTRCEDKKKTQQNQNEMFEALYYLLISRHTGPRLPLLIEITGSEKAYQLVQDCIRN
jgi:lysyl-tRNA synthetase class I